MLKILKEMVIWTVSSVEYTGMAFISKKGVQKVMIYLPLPIYFHSKHIVQQRLEHYVYV